MSSSQTGPIYSAEQIRIPPELPEILKSYAKFIIKNQPEDIIGSSATYQPFHNPLTNHVIL
jgi:hypothetical protein